MTTICVTFPRQKILPFATNIVFSSPSLRIKDKEYWFPSFTIERRLRHTLLHYFNCTFFASLKVGVILPSHEPPPSSNSWLYKLCP